MKYDLVGIDGNAFSIMGYVTRGMREQGFSRSDINAYLADAKSSDYNHLLVVSIDMVDKLNDMVGDTGDDYLDENLNESKSNTPGQDEFDAEVWNYVYENRNKWFGSRFVPEMQEDDIRQSLAADEIYIVPHHADVSMDRLCNDLNDYFGFNDRDNRYPERHFWWYNERKSWFNPNNHTGVVKIPDIKYRAV